MRLGRRKRIELADVRRLDAQAGDVLVIRLASARMPGAAIAALREELDEHLPGVKVLVLEPGADVDLVRQGPPPRPGPPPPGFGLPERSRHGPISASRPNPRPGGR